MNVIFRTLNNLFHSTSYTSETYGNVDFPISRIFGNIRHFVARYNLAYMLFDPYLCLFRCTLDKSYVYYLNACIHLNGFDLNGGLLWQEVLC